MLIVKFSVCIPESVVLFSVCIALLILLVPESDVLFSVCVSNVFEIVCIPLSVCVSDVFKILLSVCVSLLLLLLLRCIACLGLETLLGLGGSICCGTNVGSIYIHLSGQFFGIIVTFLKFAKTTHPLSTTSFVTFFFLELSNTCFIITLTYLLKILSTALCNKKNAFVDKRLCTTSVINFLNNSGFIKTQFFKPL